MGELGRGSSAGCSHCAELTGKLAQVYRRARRAGQLHPALTPAPAASATCSFLVGLVRLWLMDRAGGPIRSSAGTIIRSHIDSYRNGH